MRYQLGRPTDPPFAPISLPRGRIRKFRRLGTQSMGTLHNMITGLQNGTYKSADTDTTSVLQRWDIP
jgi:hypothetical protein